MRKVKMEKFVTVLLALLFLTGCKSLSKSAENYSEIPANKKWSERMALTLMKKYPEAYMIDDKAEPKWDYVHGLNMIAFEELYAKTNDSRYIGYVKGYADATIDKDGKIPSYKFDNFNIDMIIAGHHLFDLYAKTKDHRYLTALKTLRLQLEKQPRTSEGGFWHKKIYPNQMWLDGLYMGQPFYAEYAALTKNDAAFDDIANQFIYMENHARDAKTGLLYHGWDESKVQKWAIYLRRGGGTSWSPHCTISPFFNSFINVFNFFNF